MACLARSASVPQPVRARIDRRLRRWTIASTVSTSSSDRPSSAVRGCSLHFRHSHARVAADIEEARYRRVLRGNADAVRQAVDKVVVHRLGLNAICVDPCLWMELKGVCNSRKESLFGVQVEFQAHGTHSQTPAYRIARSWTSGRCLPSCTEAQRC